MGIEHIQADNVRLERENQDLRIKLGQAERSYEKAELGRHLERAMNKANVHPHAREDIYRRMIESREWKLDSRGQVYRDVQGKGPQMTGEGYYSFDEYLQVLPQEAPHLFGTPETKDTKSMKNPFVKGPDWNMTQQGQIERDNPELARQLAAEAGVTLPPAPKRWGF